MEEKIDHHMFLISVVAIVAIVAIIIVVLILNANGKNQAGNAYSFEACMAVLSFCHDADDHCNECTDSAGNAYQCPSDIVSQCKRESGDCWANARSCFNHLYNAPVGAAN